MLIHFNSLQGFEDWEWWGSGLVSGYAQRENAWKCTSQLQIKLFEEYAVDM